MFINSNYHANMYYFKSIHTGKSKSELFFETTFRQVDNFINFKHVTTYYKITGSVLLFSAVFKEDIFILSC
jgi:hypothetical protein